MVNNNNDEIIPYIPKFKHAFRFSFVVSDDRVFVIDVCQKDLKLEIGQTFDSKIN